MTYNTRRHRDEEERTHIHKNLEDGATMTVHQCARMPMVMQTLEFIPNSLHDEWTKAWNDVHKLRDAAGNDDARDRALKWILWLPQGLHHAPSKGGQKEARQFRDLARRLVMWRRKDMMGLIKVWKGAVVVGRHF